MTSTTKAVLAKAKPWSGQTAWWVLLIEGLLALGLGLYALIRPQNAVGWILYLLAAFLLVDGLIAVVHAMRRKAGRTFQLVRSGAAIVAGLIVILMPFFNFGDTSVAAWVLAVGLFVVAIFTLLGSAAESTQAARGFQVVWGLVMLGLSALLVYAIFTNASIVTFAAWTLIAAGLFLLIFAAFVWNQARQRATASDPPAVKPSKSVPLPETQTADSPEPTVTGSATAVPERASPETSSDKSTE